MADSNNTEKQISNLSANAKPFIPSKAKISKWFEKYISQLDQSLEKVAYERFISCLNCLIANPENYHTVSRSIVSIFDGMNQNYKLIIKAMVATFDAAIKNPNFTYMGAKIYALFHVIDITADALFPKLFAHQIDYHTYYILNDEYVLFSTVNGTLLFFAELYYGFHYYELYKTKMCASIVKIIKFLLVRPSVENVRCICLAIKLVGILLKKDTPTQLQEIMKKLVALNTAKPCRYHMITKIITLESNNFGYIPESPESENPRRKNLVRKCKPVHYGPDGKVLTNAEREFLENECNQQPESIIDWIDECDDEFDYELDSEMNLMAQQDYVEFLKETYD